MEERDCAPPDDDTYPPADDDSEVEIADLRPAARHPVAQRRFWSARLGGLTPRQRLLRLASGAVIVALGLALIALSLRPELGALLAKPTPTLAPIALHTGPSLFSTGDQKCPHNAAWSPDSKRIALLVEEPACTLATYQQGYIDLYDVSQQQTTLEIGIDLPIFAALGVAPPPAATPVPTQATATPGPWQTPTIFHYSVVWSADGRELAVSFVATLSFVPTEEDVPGLALLSFDGAPERVLLGPRSGGELSRFKEWDLLSGQLVNASATLLYTSEFGALDPPPALGYAWQGSTLTPQSSPDAAPGVPAGDASFSIWQPGEIVVATPAPESDITSPPADVFLTSFTAWSPDGRFIAADAATGLRLAPSDRDPPTQQALEWLGITPLPVIAPPPCLQSAFDAITSSTVINYQTNAHVAWRADGLVLALSQDGSDVTIFECATGRMIASALSHSPGSNAVGLSWSPDGTWLLLPNGALLEASQLGH